MKELTQVEINSVHGAGIFSSVLGAPIGAIVDQANASKGITSNYKDAFTSLFKGIDSILTLNVAGAISNMGKGITAIVAECKSVDEQKAALGL